MGESRRTHRRLVGQVSIIALLVAAYIALSSYFQLVLHRGIVYTHFAYIPIILAGMWWGRKGVLVAGILGAVILSFHLFGFGAGELWNDVARIFFFVVIALCIGILSERVTAGQDALRLSEEKYRLLISKSLAGIMVYRNESILFANPQLSGMLGYPPKDMIGMPIWELFDDRDRAMVRELVQKRKRDGLSDLRYECRLSTRDGKTIWADVASSIASYEGKPAVLVCVYDITDRKEAEEKRRNLQDIARKQEEQLIHSTRLAELGEMAAAVAHELNQPLTGIRNFARNAFYMIEKNVGTSDEVKDNLRLISEQVDRASRIINQMRELTRRSEQEFKRVDINGTIRESVEFLTPQFKLSGVEVSLDLAKDLPEVMGDRIRLEQVFLNLLTNARQAMGESAERRLGIKTCVNSENGREVMVAITDTGKGFTDEEARKLFQPFFSTKKPGHGTGLGLSISLSIIKDHNGTISATGTPGKGATFTVRLPIPTAENAPEGSTDNE